MPLPCSNGANGVKNANPVQGIIGIALNGATIYNDANAQQQDAYVNEKATFDKCNGHADNRGAYHYHSEVPEGEQPSSQACLILS
jgi:hypothetical protein